MLANAARTMCLPRDALVHSAVLRLLKMVSCGCKAGCGRACSCRKLGLHCSQMCNHCLGQTCSNIQL